MYEEYETETCPAIEDASAYNEYALRKVVDSLNFALSLPSDPQFKKACRTIENLHSSDGIINQIRERYKNADDLAKIVAAIEVMREELIEESAARFERRTHA
jgi:hypothetical protein